MMRIGILTYHRPCNFGANLQAYSSFLYLQSKGYEAMVIDYIRPQDINHYKNAVLESQYKAHSAFIENNIALTRRAYNGTDIRDIVLEYKIDAILIGADAVWRKPDDDYVYFAKWLFSDETICNVPVASLSAAHMGDGFKMLGEKGIAEMHQYLSMMKYISVRDKWTCETINKDIFNGEPFVRMINPDPVFMLSKFVNAEWVNLGQKSKGYYLITLPSKWLASSKKKLILKFIWFYTLKFIVNLKGYKLVELPLPEAKSGMKFDLSVDYPLDPIQWFLWIKHAKAFCGLRFHAVVSAISNGTPFFSIDTYGPHSKIKYLLEGTKMEKYRAENNIENVNPSLLVNMLETIDTQSIIEERDKFIRNYEDNMEIILKAIGNE